MQYLGAVTDLGVAAFLQNRPGAVEPLSNAEKPFQETIRKTMKKIQALRQQPAQAMAPEDCDDIVAQMLKELREELRSGGTDITENEGDFWNCWWD